MAHKRDHQIDLSNCNSCSQYIKKLYESELNKAPSLSVRKFSQTLGFENPSLVSDVLNVNKKPSVKLLEAVLNYTKLTYSEEQYIKNLYTIEKNDPDGSAKKENELILHYWSLEINTDDLLSAPDLIMKGLVGHYNGGLTLEEACKKVEVILPKAQVSFSLNYLVEKKCLIKKESRFLVNKNSTPLNTMSAKGLSLIHKVIDKINNLSGHKTMSSLMTFHLDSKSASEIESCILQALEKIALIIEKNDHSCDIHSTKTLYALYLNYSSLEPVNC